MTILSTPEFLSAVVAIVAAAAGYAFREHRNRARPFFQVSEIDGAMRKNADPVEVPDEIAAQTSQSSFRILRRLEGTQSLDNVFAGWDHTDDVKKFWSDVRSKIDNFVNATADSERLAALGELLNGKYFDKWFCVLVAADKLVPPRVDTTTPVRVVVSDSQERNGCVWIGIPGNTLQFGKEMNIQILRTKIQPFLDAVARLDIDSLTTTLEVFKGIMERESAVAAATGAALNGILDTNSRWFFEMFIANLSPYPMIVETTARLLVQDAHGSRFSEPCALLTVVDKDGQRSIKDAKVPLVIRSGDDLRCGLITIKPQRSMERGMALREAFNGSGAKCRLELWFQKVGLIKRQRYTSQPVAFVGSRKPEI